MTPVRVGFAGGTTAIDRAIQAVSGSEYCDITHAFIYLFGGIVEAEGVKEFSDKYPGVWLHPPNKYQPSNEHVKIVEVNLPDIKDAKAKACALLGTPYSYHGCLEAAAELAGIELPVDGSHTVMCSEAVTMIIRAGGLYACSGIEPDYVTPVMLYNDLINNHGGVLV